MMTNSRNTFQDKIEQDRKKQAEEFKKIKEFIESEIDKRGIGSLSKNSGESDRDYKLRIEKRRRELFGDMENKIKSQIEIQRKADLEKNEPISNIDSILSKFKSNLEKEKNLLQSGNLSEGTRADALSYLVEKDCKKDGSCELEAQKKAMQAQVDKARAPYKAKNIFEETRIELEQVKNELEKLKKTDTNPANTEKYYRYLLNDLQESGIIDKVDAQNYDARLKSGFSYEEVISKLERLKKEGKALKVDDFRFSSLPKDAYQPLGEGISKWDEGHLLSNLNTMKWRPVELKSMDCYNTAPCDKCYFSHSSVDNHLRVRDWDKSRKITEFNINKAWLMNNKNL